MSKTKCEERVTRLLKQRSNERNRDSYFVMFNFQFCRRAAQHISDDRDHPSFKRCSRSLALRLSRS